MASLLPLATYNLALKPFSPAPAIEDDFPVTIRITLAAVDPEASDDKAEPSTLRLLKRSNAFIDDESDDEDDDDEEDELDDEEAEAAATAEDDEEEDLDDDLDEEEDLDDEDGEVSEFVVCTLSPKVQFQQTIDITINPEEEVYFVVTGSYPIHLSGNYVEHPADDEDSDSDEEDYLEDDEDEYDMTPDEDELIYDLEDLEDASDIENKIEELVEQDSKKRSAAEEDVEEDEEEEEEEAAPVTKKSKKAKSDDKKSVQFTKELEQGPTGSTLVEKKETKKEKKERAKKEAAAAVAKETAESGEPKDKKYPTKTLLGGVIAEDRKLGKGPQAKSGNKVGIRYIGKLKNGKVFDKNTSGKPFSFGLGKGECIKGFDLGVAGMAVGGERRVVIPAKMGYGSQSLPGIPANSELTFDIKLVSIK
ncbi:FK506-binding protein 3 [[Candida] railenensis]|uniref:FK506-binding protein n=1 Tax=[Candida] railenensis TaxID=45579 RepID=A0A9P0QM01_9ASCO|nr:FK506-binding protein 3 [[Candida] railenensis]